MKKHLFYLGLCLALVHFITGCGSASAPQRFKIYGDTTSLQGLTDLHVKTQSKDEAAISKMRVVALKETAITIGAQAGLAARTTNINKVLEKDEHHLNTVFNFGAMLMDQHVLPPVLTTAQDTLNLANNDVIRLSDRTFQIVRQARFVSTPPTWREYLWMSFGQPSPPDATLLPKTDAEREVWKTYVTEGWQEGEHQADQIYQENLARLQRDYTGMALYRQLLMQHMVSKPFVARSELGITGNDSSIRINDQVLRITALPKLTPNSSQWQPVLTDNEQ